MAKKDKNRDLNEMLNDMIGNGMRKTNRWVSLFQESLRYFFSDQLHGRKKRKRWDWVVVNYIWPSAMQEIAKLSRNDPKILARPNNDDDADFAETWQHLLDWLWQNGMTYRKDGTGMKLETIAMLLDQKLFGYCVSKILWDENVDYDDETGEDIGDVRHKLWHPALFWADDDEFVQNGNCGTQRHIRLEDAIKQWPFHKKELEDEATEFQEPAMGFSTDYIRGQFAGGQATSGTGGTDGGITEGVKPSKLLSIITRADKMSGQLGERDVKVVKVEEVYFKDDKKRTEVIVEEIPAEELVAQGRIVNDNGIFVDPETGEPIPSEDFPTNTRKVTRRVFPRGRHVIRVGKVILNEKEEDQVYKYKRWPFVIVPHYLLPHMWQGIDAIQMFKSSQDIINISASHLFNNMKMFGDPKIAIEKGAIDTPPGRSGNHYKIGAGAGSIIRLVKGALGRGALKIIDPPQISAGALQLYGMHVQEFKNITGLQSIAKGEKQPGKMTATESQVLAISSNDRITLQSKYFDAWIIGVAQMTADIVADKYDEGRMVRIVGEDKTRGIVEFSQGLKDLEFDVDIIRGSTLPFDEEKHLAKILQAYQLLQQPANPLLPLILRELGIPNWRKVLQEHEPYQQYLKLLQLYDAVVSGEMDPQQAAQVLTQEIVKIAEQRGDNLNAAGDQNAQGNRI